MTEITRYGPDKEGYVKVQVNSDTYYYEHQLTALVDNSPAEVFGEKQIVHHRNEMPMYNTRENLEVMSRAEHQRHHVGNPDGEYEFTEDELREMHHEKEMSQGEIAEEKGISRNTVGNRLHEYDIEVREYDEDKRIYDVSDERLREMRQDGMTYKQISEEVGCARTTIGRRIRNLD